MIVAVLITIWIAMAVGVSFVPPIVVGIQSAKETPGLPTGMTSLFDIMGHVLLDPVVQVAIVALILLTAILWIGGQAP
jgi:hypothetical protein